MVLPRGGGVALWRQIQMHFERQLSDGSLQPGDRLPTEARLSEQFGVNRHTVRRALAGLETRGLIRVEQGRGTFVREHVLAYRISERTRFSDNVAGEQRSPSRTLVSLSERAADPVVAEALNLAPETRVLCVEMVGDSDGRRISYSEHHFPAPLFPGLAEALQAEQSVSRALRRVGIADYRRAWTRVTARMPSGREADMLQQPRSRPVLVSESVNVDPDGRLIEFGLTRFNSDWVRIVLEP